MNAIVAAATVLVVPFAPRGEAPAEAGVAVAEGIIDVVVQGKAENFLTLKQLDSVLRRRDLHLTDANVPAGAVELGRALGASEVITGEARLEQGKWLIDARRLAVGDGKVTKAAKVEGARAALPSLAQQAGAQLLGVVIAAPITTSSAALEAAARCEVELARHSIGAHARMTLSADRLSAAERSCREAVKADPKLGLARAGLAISLAARGRLSEARTEAREAQKGRFVPLAVLAEAFSARKLRDLKGWRRILANAVAERPGFLHALGYLAEDAMQSGEHEQAIAHFDRYLARSPGHPWAMAEKAHELARLGERDEAVELSEKALGQNPGDPELLIETASRYLDAGRDPRAEPLLEQAMSAKPPRPKAALRLGYLYFRGHKLPQARETLEQCLALATREDEARIRGVAHADLARVDARQNKYLEAVAELKKARAEGNNRLPCEEPELARWKERPELKAVCVEAAAAAADEGPDDDAAPVDF